jgi:FAD/FMN-containing dehydrogenase
MTETLRIPRFAGQLIGPSDPSYDQHREVWNAIVDRRPGLIARCTNAADVAEAVRFGRDTGLEIAVKCGGHSMVGLSVPEGGLMIDLTPMGAVRIDPERRRAFVQGGSLLRNLDRAAEPFGLATTAGNVSHTGVGGLTLGGGMGWLARQFGLSCDNVEAYTVVTADGKTVRASANDEPELFWALRGGGGNFGIVTEFEFSLHPTTGRALVVDLFFDPADAPEALRVWRGLLADAPRSATLTTEVMTAQQSPSLPERVWGRPVVAIGYVWVGDLDAARDYLRTFRQVGVPLAEQVEEMSYVTLQSSADEKHHHGKRRYSKGHYLTELSDGAIEAFLSRGVSRGASEPDWANMPNGDLQAYGGAISDVDDDESAFSQRATLIEFGGGTSWLDAAEDDRRIATARAYGAALELYASGVYVNVIGDEGQAGVQRAYPQKKLARLMALKRRYDPDNVFHLNHNIRPA